MAGVGPSPSPVCSISAALCYLSSAMGFATPSNFIFVLGFVFGILIMLSLSLIASKQADAIKNLTQRVALLEKDIESILRDK